MKDNDTIFRLLPIIIIVISLLPNSTMIYASSAPIKNVFTINDDYPQQDGGSDERLFQYRSMWLEGYQIINHSEVLKVIQVARDCNINCVTPLINGHVLGTFYNSSYHPRYRELAWHFDPLMDLIREAHKYNIHVMPWFHTMYDYHALTDNPEWGMVRGDGYRSTVWMNPVLPEVRNYLSNVTYQLFNDYPLDGIHLDTIRFPSSSYGYDDYSIQKYYDEGWSSFTEFRKQQITDVVAIIYDTISSIRPYVWIGADIGSGSFRETSWFQDTDRWSSMGKIDFVTPMVYTLNSDNLENNIRWNIEVHSCPVVCGNYVYVPEDPYYGTVPNEETGIDILLNQTERAINAGALGTCFFAYKFLVEHPSYHTALRENVFSQKALCPLKKQTTHVRRMKWDFEGEQDREGWRTVDMGNYYPDGGVWSISSCRSPKLMSPFLNISSEGINVIEISMRTDARLGNLSIYWSNLRTIFSENKKVQVRIKDNTDWNLYSIHLDDHDQWTGSIRYIRVVPEFKEPANITFDLIHLSWMPYCVRNWSYLGPFLTGETEGLLDRRFIENENDPRPRLQDVDGGREWRSFGMERDQVDLRFPLGHLRYATTYAHVYVRSNMNGPAELRIGNSDGARIFFNGEEVYRNDKPRRVGPDQNMSYITLEKGINTILVKLSVYENENSFFIRITDIGNRTMEGLEYFEELPLLPAPEFDDFPSHWMPTNSTTLKWNIPSGTLGLDHFKWNLDGEIFGTSSGDQITLSDLEDGIHTFELVPVDDMGFPGISNTTIIMIDTEVPRVDRPRSHHDIVTTPLVEWNWELFSEPISGIEHYLVTVEEWGFSSTEVNRPIKERVIKETRFVLEDSIKNSYNYRLIVTAVSGSGLVHTVRSDGSVFIDLTPPAAPTILDIRHLSPGSRSYLCSWKEPVENIVDGIDRYEVWYRSGNDDWEMMCSTEDRQTVFERPLEMNISLKVRALDVSGHIGPFSNIESVKNQPPTPNMELSGDIFCGRPFFIRSGDLDDIDGQIVEYSWFLDGLLVSDQQALELTLPSGVYDLELREKDDLGAIGTERILLSINDNDPVFNSSITKYLERTSVVDVHLKPIKIVHYSNRTVVIENTTKDTAPSTGEVLFSFFMKITAFIMVLLLVLSFLSIIAKEGRRRLKKTDPVLPSDESRKGRKGIITKKRSRVLDIESINLDKMKMIEAINGSKRQRPRLSKYANGFSPGTLTPFDNVDDKLFEIRLHDEEETDEDGLYMWHEDYEEGDI